jgi:hypothetical protein
MELLQGDNFSPGVVGYCSETTDKINTHPPSEFLRAGYLNYSSILDTDRVAYPN